MKKVLLISIAVMSLFACNRITSYNVCYTKLLRDDQGTYRNAYSLTGVGHFLLNFNQKFSLNGYAVYTTSKGGAATNDKALFFNGTELYNRKTDFVVGERGIYYLTKWLNLIQEIHYAKP